MSTRLCTVAAGLAVAASWLSVVPSAKASFDLVNLGTDTFSIDPGATTADYSQTVDSLIFDGTFALGDTLGGTFAAQNWTAYETFGLRMSLTGTNSNLSFTVQFYDSTFAVINSYQGTTSGLSLAPIVMLSLSLPGTTNFSSVAGMQFTWDAPGAINTSITEVVGFAPPTSGFFVACAPGGVKFLTGNNSVSPFDTTLASNSTNWSPPTFAMTSLSASGAAWAVLSDSNAKTDVSVIDHRETLKKIAALPVTSWEYENDTGRVYLGPMAQDFHAAFQLGSDNKRITTIDTDGVALSALKGLIEELRERQECSAAQARKLNDLEAELRFLQNRLRNSLPPAE